jgi:hypothetical protein
MHADAGRHQLLAGREFRNFSRNRPEMTNLNHQNAIRRVVIFISSMPRLPVAFLDSAEAENRM